MVYIFLLQPYLKNQIVHFFFQLKKILNYELDCSLIFHMQQLILAITFLHLYLTKIEQYNRHEYCNSATHWVKKLCQDKSGLQNKTDNRLNQFNDW